MMKFTVFAASLRGFSHSMCGTTRRAKYSYTSTLDQTERRPSSLIVFKEDTVYTPTNKYGLKFRSIIAANKIHILEPI